MFHILDYVHREKKTLRKKYDGSAGFRYVQLVPVLMVVAAVVMMVATHTWMLKKPVEKIRLRKLTCTINAPWVEIGVHFFLVNTQKRIRQSFTMKHQLSSSYEEGSGDADPDYRLIYRHNHTYNTLKYHEINSNL